MHWVYILQCKDGFLYVGETNRLYRRFGEHFSELGGCFNTSLHVPEKIIAIYQVNDLAKFECLNKKLVDIEQKHVTVLLLFENGIYSPRNIFNNWKSIDFDTKESSKCAENLVTLSLMNHLNNFETIRGGDYCRVDLKSSVNFIREQEKYSKELPLCKCKLPCDVSFYEPKKQITFYCAKKNLYEKMRDIFDVDDSEPCNFFKTYEKYNEVSFIYNRELVVFKKEKEKEREKERDEDFDHIKGMISFGGSSARKG